MSLPSSPFLPPPNSPPTSSLNAPSESPPLRFLLQYLGLSLKNLLRDIRRPLHSLLLVVFTPAVIIAVYYLVDATAPSPPPPTSPTSPTPSTTPSPSHQIPSVPNCNDGDELAGLIVFGPLIFAASSLSALLHAFSSLHENEKKLLSSLKRSGLSALAHHLSLNSTAFIFSLVSSLIAYLIGFLLSIPIFTSTNGVILLLLFTTLSTANTAASLLLSTIARGGVPFSLLAAAGVIGGMLCTLIFTVNSIEATIHADDDDYPAPPAGQYGWYDNGFSSNSSPFAVAFMFLLPWFNFGRVLQSIYSTVGFNFGTPCTNASHYTFVDLNASSLPGYPAAGMSIVALIFQSIIFTLLSFYIACVRGDDDEHALPYSFLFYPSYWFPPSSVISPAPSVGTDVIAREQQAAAASGDIRTRKLTKTYKKGGTALKEVSITFKKGECYALLGQNGAGKTTIISVLTGATNATHGTAFVGGYGDIGTNMPAIQRRVGVCPQEDLIYDELSGHEHALIYSLCRGIPWVASRREAARVLATVALSEQGAKRAKDYSGGMKRRLMAALATVGNPEYLFLDEPSSGLDPLSRRRLWNILEKLKQNRVLVLTTHMMEEADILGDRIGFLHLGRLRASGTPLELKRRLGTGFQITLTAAGPGRVAACAAASALLQDTTIDATTSQRSIAIAAPRSNMRLLRRFFEWVEANPQYVTEVALSNSTLSEVFTALVRHDRDEISGEDTLNLNSTVTVVVSEEEQLQHVAQWLSIPDSVVAHLIERGLTVEQVFMEGLKALAPEFNAGILSAGGSTSDGGDGGAEGVAKVTLLEAEEAISAAVAAGTLPTSAAAAAAASASAPVSAIVHDIGTDPTFPVGTPSPLNQIASFWLRNLAFEGKRSKKAWVGMLLFMLVLVLFNVLTRFVYVPPEDSDDTQPKGYVSTDFAVKAMFLMWATTLLQPNMIFVMSQDRKDGHRHASFLLSANHSTYWISTYTFYSSTSLLLMICYTAIGWAVGQEVYTNVPVATYVLLYAGGAFSQVSVAAFFSVALPSGALMSLVTVLLLGLLPFGSWVAIALTVGMTDDPHPYPSWLMMISPFAYGRSAALAFSCAAEGGIGNSLALCGDGTLQSSLGYLWGGSALMTLVAIYLHSVVPAEKGVPEHPLLCLKKTLAGGMAEAAAAAAAADVSQDVRVEDEGDEIERGGEGNEEDTEDSDVTAERERVKQIIAEGGETQSLLLTESVKKRYGKLMPYVVNGISVEMGMGECFCLLGPNGAGKTSLISLLTTVTSHDGGGFASVAGANVATDASVVRRRIGVCPQHDILYASLTVREHLEFACRMRGVKGVKAAARNLAQETDLDGDSFYTRSSALSGGMRRRLSIAMAVAGSPSVVFLDEPTTGLDPETRTQIWQTIKRVGRGRLVILSTHSMEEAEALSTRIGIMATGKMLCLGDPTHLKSKFGQGLRVRVVLLGKELDIVGVFKKFMPGAIVEEQAWPKFSWLVPAGSKVSQVFGIMEKLESMHKEGIRDWEICHATLLEVFVRLVEAQGQ